MFGLGVIVGVMGTALFEIVIAVITTVLAEKDRKGDSE